MRRHPLKAIFTVLLLVGGAAWLWFAGHNPPSPTPTASPTASPTAAVAPVPPPPLADPAPFRLLTTAAAPTLVPDSAALHRTLRLANTTQTLEQLYQRDDVILLANALIDTRSQAPVPIPSHLRSEGDPGSYIVQARGPLNDAFRKLLADNGAQVISYIPNNAYLVRASADAARQLATAAPTQRVLPYEPYYKLSGDLLKLAVQQRDLRLDAMLSLTLFADLREATLAELSRMGAEVVNEEPSPFGPVVTVRLIPKDSLPALARLAGVQGLEPSLPRIAANDLSRATMGVSADTVALTNYLMLTGSNALTGSNVLVAVVDTGVDSNHVDLVGRVLGDNALAFRDTAGHGTHVAGIIASTGEHGPVGTNASGSVSNANFRGKAPGAKLLSLSTASHGLSQASDFYYQQTAASSNAFISNNSWDYGSTEYTITAASYDAAVRDALPFVAGSQPLLFVFAAGNAGGGLQPGSILAPGTAKNVITVGALEQLRNITNQVHIPRWDTNGTAVWESETDSSTQVAGFSSRGNVGIGIEGPVGRFKPDVVAPGVFVVSCRSTQWDTNEYYNPTNYYSRRFSNQHVATNTYWRNSIYIPDNAVWFSIAVVPNEDSLVPFPPMPIFVLEGNIPNPTNGTYDFVGTNSVMVPPDATLTTGISYGYSVGNVTNRTVNFDVVTTIATTNDYGDWFEVLAAMNDKLGPYYRYEGGTRPFAEGTSMAAADVSGFLALMKQYLDERLGLTNRSPALMKALLINGARSLGEGYRFPTRDTLNLQGWGVPYLPTTLQPGIGAFTNASAGARSNSLWLIDQDLTNALSTGWSQTRNVSVDPNAQGDPLRITLAWTDPPGNPNASLKLVNNLDLIVTNLDTGDVYFGNDFGLNSDYTMPWPTNELPRLDSVNNVENVYLPSPLGTNYSVTVLARRVNVNALTARTNEVAQDYVLVISCGDGYLTNALSLKESAVVSNALPNVTSIRAANNGFFSTNDQVAGASSPLIGTNLLTNAIAYGVISPGVTNQWTFYVITNTTTYSNALFMTRGARNASLPRMAVQAAKTSDQGREYNGATWADIDLYVSTLPGLTNLDPVALATADKSLTRGGNELVYYSNSVNAAVYYVGVKSEDQMAAFYSFISLFSELPFNQNDTNVTFFPVPALIPDGTPEQPAGAELFGVCFSSSKIRRATATMDVTHYDFGDLLGNLNLDGQFAVLNNHTTGNGNTNQILRYDDSREDSPAGTQGSDGPGSLNNFMGRQAGGDWGFVMVDNAMFNTGMINGFTVSFEPQPEDGKQVTVTVQPRGWKDFVVDVPVGAVDLTIAISGFSLPMEIYIRKGELPTLTEYDKKSIPPIQPPGGYLSLTKYDSPPLSPGRYYFSLYNPNASAQTVTVVYHITMDLDSIKPTLYTVAEVQPIPDDLVSYAVQSVTNRDLVAAVEVGLRIEHPRVSDLAVTLVSPRGTRVLLVENRGYASTNGFGSDTLSTNVIPVDSSGGAAAYTNVVDTGTTSGSFSVAWEFFTIPDRLKAYYEGVVIFDTGLVSGAGVATVNYGPGQSTAVIITVNEGDNPDPQTAWEYTLTATHRQYQYLVLTENTNLTHTPIKFAEPPLGSLSSTFSNSMYSSFEGAVVGSYSTNAVVDGWTVLSNQVTVVTTNATVPIVAYQGSNYLAPGSGAMGRLVPTIAGKRYALSLASRQVPLGPSPVAWWRAEGNGVDSAGGHNGALVGGGSYASGMVGQAFKFNGTDSYVEVPDAPALRLTNTLTIEFWLKRPQIGGYNACLVNKGGDWTRGALNYGAALSASGNRLHFLFAGGTRGGGNINDLNWHHCALVAHQGDVDPLIYLDGVQQPITLREGVATINLYPSTEPLRLGAQVDPESGWFYYTKDTLDEVSFYDRALSAAEIQAIYAAGAASKCGLPSPPASCALAGGQVTIDGQPVVALTPADTNWTVSTASFIATAGNTVVTVEAEGGAESGLLLDELIIKPEFQNLYFLPEQPLDSFLNESAFGDWKLELWDNRAGATNPPPQLLSWQLSFYFVNTVPATTGLAHGQAVTNTIPPGGLLTYEVPVPAWAKFATNQLSGSGPLSLIFDQYAVPTGSNATSIVLLTNVNSGTVVLSALSKPPLWPGNTYYLGVQNNGATPVTFVIEVDFDITPLVNGVPITSAASTANLPRYFQFDVSAATTAVSFSLTNLNGDANLYVRRGVPLPTPALYDYAGVNGGSDFESIVIFTNSTPQPLAPGRYYLGVFNNDFFPVRYTILATEYTNAIPNVITLTNGVPYVAKSTAAGAADYYRFTVTSDAVRGQFEVNHPDGQVALYMRRGFPPFPGPAVYDYASTNPGTNDQLIAIYNYSPIPLTQGDWFLVVTNLTAAPVSYSAVASTWTSYGTPIYVTGYRGYTNSFCLTWNSLPGAHYVVQGRPDLLTPGWFDASPTITPTGYQATWCLGVTSPYQFFRVTEGTSTNTTAAPAAPE